MEAHLNLIYNYINPDLHGQTNTFLNIFCSFFGQIVIFVPNQLFVTKWRIYQKFGVFPPPPGPALLVNIPGRVWPSHLEEPRPHPGGSKGPLYTHQRLAQS